MRLEGIAVVAAQPRDSLSGNATALLREIAVLLARLIECGEPASIDLQSLPLTPADRSWLQEQLGPGEVAIALQAAGPSEIRETGLPGVWWVTHRGPGGRVLSEFIEVTRMPDIVLPPVEDMREGLDRLQGRFPLSSEPTEKENDS